MSSEGTIAGWYADPGGSGALRWWDGLQWTEHIQSAPPIGSGGVAPGWGGPPPAYGAQPPGYGAQGSGSGTQEPGYGAQGSGSGPQEPGYGAQPPAYGTQGSGSGTQEPGFGTQPGHGTQEPGSGGQQAGWEQHAGRSGQPPAWGGGQPPGSPVWPGSGGGGWGGQPAGGGGMPPRTLWSTNRYAFIAGIVSIVYLLLAFTVHFVLIGILPLLMSVRSMRIREPLAPVAVGLAVIVLVVSITVLAH